jgi:glucose/arabinose dehydrogenase
MTILGSDMYVASFGQSAVSRLPILPGGLLGPPTPYVTGLSSPLGVAFAEDGTLFVADSHASSTPGRSTAGRVWAIPPGGGDAGTVGEIVVDELPNGRHNTNGLAVKDGRLYIANGNSTDDGVAGGQPETQLSGTILSVPLSARDLTPDDLQPEPTPEDPTEPGLIIEAFGMRNPFDLAFRPGTDELWTPSNGPDALDPFGEDLLHKASIPSPPPDLGFPACVYKGGPDGPVVAQNPAVEDTQTCGEHEPPVATLGLHVSANGIAFGPDDGFWDGDAFIAMYGNNPGETNAGHKVVRVPVDENGNAGPLEDVYTSSAPLDVTFGADGLYVADFLSGQITLLRAL